MVSRAAWVAASGGGVGVAARGGGRALSERAPGEKISLRCKRAAAASLRGLGLKNALFFWRAALAATAVAAASTVVEGASRRSPVVSDRLLRAIFS